MTKQTIKITAEDLNDLKKGYNVEISLDGVPAYIMQVDYETGLKFKGMNVGINYFAPDPEYYEIELDEDVERK